MADLRDARAIREYDVVHNRYARDAARSGGCGERCDRCIIRERCELPSLSTLIRLAGNALQDLLLGFDLTKL